MNSGHFGAVISFCLIRVRNSSYFVVEFTYIHISQNIFCKDHVASQYNNVEKR